ncbi:MAG TPA: SDR family NAD(P)-dependent oxidoreductase, partial [Ilumatobacteraceae bacterium]|nr:SDR family NAD(P)-dependent oxidoreductase [Ilumatobacteraceae bacterium]
MDTLRGKGAVITGGASGIGLATAKVLASKGAKIVLADVEEGALDRAVDGLRAAGADAHGVVCDVRSLEGVQAMADAAFSAV